MRDELKYYKHGRFLGARAAQINHTRHKAWCYHRQRKLAAQRSLLSDTPECADRLSLPFLPPGLNGEIMSLIVNVLRLFPGKH